MSSFHSSPIIAFCMPLATRNSLPIRSFSTMEARSRFSPLAKRLMIKPSNTRPASMSMKIQKRI